METEEEKICREWEEIIREVGIACITDYHEGIGDLPKSLMKKYKMISKLKTKETQIKNNQIKLW